MNRARQSLLACLAAATSVSLALAPLSASAAPRGHGGGVSGSHGGYHAPGAPGRGSDRHWGHSRYHGSSGWGWGLGLAFGIPWALGWYDPWWWGPGYYYPSYAYGPVYRGYADACAQDEDCWGERLARAAPPPPTTQVEPASPGEPTQHPLHLNYCDSAKAWFPQVRECPGGWRLVLPQYERAP
jgi:hypothetical protein